MLGAFNLDPEYKTNLTNQGYYFDDTGDNISNLNQWLGDLTGLYWIWKNTSDEFVGTNQYRRYYIDEHLSTLTFDPKILYISTPMSPYMVMTGNIKMSLSKLNLQRDRIG